MNVLCKIGVGAVAVLALAGCVPATSVGDSAGGAGTGVVYFVAHGGGYVGEARVTTNSAGKVTDAVLNEWQGPSGWATFTAMKNGSSTSNDTFTAGQMVRFKMAGKADGYCYFYYNSGNQDWIEVVVPATGSFSAPNSTTLVTSGQFDKLMAKPLYGEAYAVACRAVDEGTDSTAVQNVTVAADLTKTGISTAISHYGMLNKNNSAATYMSPSASSIGYRLNAKALQEFFKAHPDADYRTATTITVSKAVEGTTTYYPAFAKDSKSKTKLRELLDSASVAVPSAYTAASDALWKVSGIGKETYDGVSGATYSDFPSYALELQQAYLQAKAGGSIKSLN